MTEPTRSRPGVVRALAVVLLIGLGATGAAPASAQAPGISPGPWQRVATEHFLFLFPESLADWALATAGRMEAVHDAVAAMVGYAPAGRVTVLVDDPSNISNGSMNPGPLLYLFPTPPSPRSMIGENRGWAEILAVHEFAHAAHLTRPSRNPVDRFLWGLIPIPVTGLMVRTPRWAAEGYATYVEGRLTGSGRPHGVWRPAVLRTWALEGELPTYGAVSGARGFYGGAMAYLVGSAFLEWLVSRDGGDPAVLPDVWRRLTARERRSFDDAFTGVFGAPPDELYGRFTVAVTARALAVRDAVDSAGGVVDGALFQRLSWDTGDPAVSPDGERLAVVLRSEDRPPRLVVMATTPDTLTTRARERRERIFAADPEDVEPVPGRPRAQRPEATLWPVLGRAYEAPRFMPDGRGILVVRSDVVAGGRSRPDLFLWEWERGGVRRITHGAAIREADPSPDGTWAAGVRCLDGRCDLVRIDLATGAVRTLVAAGLFQPYYHPRVAPDGRTVVASLQDGGTWRLVAVGADGSDLRFLGPDDGAERFDAAFLPDGEAMVVTSSRGGIFDLERLDLATGAVRPLTRVLGAAVAPAPTPDGAVFFLSLHSRGWDLRRLPLDDAATGPLPHLAASLAPAAPGAPAPGDTFALGPVGPVRPYGLGPRFRILLPMLETSVDGTAAGAALAGTDPIGRFSWQLQGLVGAPDSWHGGAARLRFRGVRPWLGVEAFALAGPVPGRRVGLLPLPSGAPIPSPARFPDNAYLGGAATLELDVTGLRASHALAAGGSGGRLPDDRSRWLGFARYGLVLRQGPGAGGGGLTERVVLQGGIGRTGDADWRRWRVDGAVALRGHTLGLGLRGSVGGTDAAPGSAEAFTVGGPSPALVDPAILGQRVAMPALPAGLLQGDRVRTVRAELYGIVPGTLFYWTGDARGDGLGWYRLLGIEAEGDVPGIPYLRLPAIRLRFGVARTLTDPDAREWRGWGVLTYRP